MNPSPLFRMRANGPLTLGTARVLRGAEFLADAAGAAQLLQQRLATLVDEQELPRLARALGGGQWIAPTTR